MCEADKRFFLYLPLALLFVSTAGVLRAGEREPWYLISETELRSIEEYLAKSEREKRNWLSQAQNLRLRAGNSEERSARLETESASLNRQLAEAGVRNRRLEQSFNEYERDRLIQISLKNGEIAGLNRSLAEQTLKTEKYRGIARDRLVIITALGAAWVIFIVFKVLRFFRIIK